MPSRKYVTLTFEPSGLRTQVRKGSRVLNALTATNVGIRSECGGRGVCGKCKIVCKDPESLGTMAKAEKESFVPV